MKHYSELSSSLMSYKRVKICIHHHSLHFPASTVCTPVSFLWCVSSFFLLHAEFLEEKSGPVSLYDQYDFKTTDWSLLSHTHTWTSSSDEYETFTGKPYEFHIFPYTFHPTCDMNESVLCGGKMYYYYCSNPSDLQQKPHFHQKHKNVVHCFTCSNINCQMPFWFKFMFCFSCMVDKQLPLKDY